MRGGSGFSSKKNRPKIPLIACIVHKKAKNDASSYYDKRTFLLYFPNLGRQKYIKEPGKVSNAGSISLLVQVPFGWREC